MPTRFRSLLFGETSGPLHPVAEPDCFGDLNLDQVGAELEARRPGYDLLPFFRQALHDPDLIRFRQDVFRDLDGGPAREPAEAFAVAMRTARQRVELANKSHFDVQRERWILDATLAYCDGVADFAAALRAANPASQGLRTAGDDLTGYLDATEFQKLHRDARHVRDSLDGVRYNMLLRGEKITVAGHDDEADYETGVVELFARFQQGTPTQQHRGKLSSHPDMDHIEAAVTELVAKLHADLFAELTTFCRDHARFFAEGVARLDRELQFYLAYLDCLAPLREAGLATCYPDVTRDSKQLNAEDCYDLALAGKLVGEDQQVVVNDIHLTDPERILVVSGPNQGGKTTLSRTVGQLHHLAALGCPVPGRNVRLFVPDRILTHYEREEHLDTLAGKLQDELQRIRDVLEHATPASLIIINEIFTSTTLEDARSLSERILERITELDALCVYVTFIDELSRLNDKTVSMVSTVDPDDPAIRTYKLVRQPADGRAYALALARAHGLTYEQLTERLGA